MALTKIQMKTSEPKRLAVKNLVQQKGKKLKTNGYSLILRCVLSHFKLDRNERTDYITKKIAEKREIETDY